MIPEEAEDEEIMEIMFIAITKIMIIVIFIMRAVIIVSNDN